MPYNITLGKAGESYAVNFVKRAGYEIVDKNLRTKISEVDIVAIDKDTLVFIEVKTRKSKKFGLPIESVTKSKIEKLKKSILLYSKNHPELPKKLRIDIVSLEINKNGEILCSITKVY